MSDRELNYELNDELLSAYLDGELAEAERAAVEARLAAEPEAKHTLQQLRMVSQSVQALPQEPIGRDLREQVLRQAERAKPATRRAAADDTASRLGDTMPQITIFRTRRSWVWASLVVAAGLMIMFLQPGNERGTNLPPLANRDNGRIANAPVDAPAQRSLGEAAPARSRAIDSAKVAGTEVPAPMASEPRGAVDSLGPGIASAPPAPSAEPLLAPAELAPPSSVASDSSAFKRPSSPAGPANSLSKAKSPAAAVDGVMTRAPVAAASPAPANRSELGATSESKLALDDAGRLSADKPQSQPAPNALGRGTAVAGALSRAAGTAQQEATEQDRLVVVHVVAKPEAFKNKTFDQLLVNNNIVMESLSESEKRLSFMKDRFSKVAETEMAADERADKQTSDEQDVDIVLVDAPPAAIRSCMAGLKKDSENYIGIAVEPPSTDKDRTDSSPLADKKSTADLSEYSRGIVPERQKDLLSQAYNYGLSTTGGRSVAPGGVGGGVNGASDALKEGDDIEPLDRQQAIVANQGRARRFYYSDEQSRRGGEATVDGEAARGGAAPQAAKKLPVRHDHAAKAEEANDNVHVLFVVSPDNEAATSAPAKKAAK